MTTNSSFSEQQKRFANDVFKIENDIEEKKGHYNLSNASSKAFYILSIVSLGALANTIIDQEKEPLPYFYLAATSIVLLGGGYILGKLRKGVKEKLSTLVMNENKERDNLDSEGFQELESLRESKEGRILKFFRRKKKQ